MSFTIPLMLYGWPLVVVAIFSKYRLPVAVATAVIGGYLLLPVRGGFDLPLLPKVDKLLIPSLSALVMSLVFAKSVSHARATPAVMSGQAGWIPRNPVVLGLFVLLLGGAFMTALTNTDAQIFGIRYIPGLRIYDSFSMVLTVLVLILSYLLARKYLADAKGQRALLLVFCLAGLGYSFLALFEIRMSPQLNRMFYGFFPNAWVQHIRGGGFRPIVFLEHGLWLGIFLSMTVLAAFSYARTFVETRGKFLLLAGWLFMTLILAKTVGALMITIALIPVVFFFSPLLQVRIAACLCCGVLLFPMLRNADVVPTEQLVEFASNVATPERGYSLWQRFHNEDILMVKAAERPLFGWGGWGRARIYNDVGRDVSTTDGYWVILFGEGGWARYIGEFGLLMAPVLLLAFTRHRRKVTMETAGLSLMLTANMIDLLPNATITPVTFLIAGSLAGRLERNLDPDAQEAEDTAEPDTRDGVSYRRDGLAPKPKPRASSHPPRGRADLIPDETDQPRYRRFTKGAPQDSEARPDRPGMQYRSPKDRAKN